VRGVGYIFAHPRDTKVEATRGEER
jgi:hypothetical protein